VLVTETSVKFTYTNTSGNYVKVYAEKNDSTPDIYVGIIAPFGTMTYTFTNLTPDTSTVSTSISMTTQRP